MVRKLADKKKIRIKEITFTSRMIREYTGLKYEFVKKHLRLLIEYEYLLIVGGKRSGVLYCYRLRADVPLEELDISMILTPDELKEKIKRDKHKEK